MLQIRYFTEVHEQLSRFVAKGLKPGDYSLERMKQLMTLLDNPQDKLKVLHVAGTSGKTSTCYYLAALLQAAGQKVGLTVSPHVDEVNERVQINLVPLPEPEFCHQLATFIDIVDKSQLEISYFELLIAFAYWVFVREQVDYAVIEVGLGGLLDGTNVISSADKVCVITDIGLDHTNVLGNTLGKIAAQKAGIIRSGNHVFVYRQSDEVMKPIADRCEQEQATLHALITPAKLDEPAYLPPFQRRNWYLAQNVFDFIAKRDKLPALDHSKLSAASHTPIPARLEVIKFGDKTVIIDGSHNGQKMTALVQGIQTLFPEQSCAVLVSFVDSERERAEGALKQLRQLTDTLVITSFSGEQDTPKQSVDPHLIAVIADKLGFKNTIIIDPKEAFEYLTRAHEELLLITGSFYLLNHIRPLVFASSRLDS